MSARRGSALAPALRCAAVRCGAVRCIALPCARARECAFRLICPRVRAFLGIPVKSLVIAMAKPANAPWRNTAAAIMRCFSKHTCAWRWWWEGVAAGAHCCTSDS